MVSFCFHFVEQLTCAFLCVFFNAPFFSLLSLRDLRALVLCFVVVWFWPYLLVFEQLLVELALFMYVHVVLGGSFLGLLRHCLSQTWPSIWISTKDHPKQRKTRQKDMVKRIASVFHLRAEKLTPRGFCGRSLKWKKHWSNWRSSGAQWVTRPTTKKTKKKNAKPTKMQPPNPTKTKNKTVFFFFQKTPKNHRTETSAKLEKSG